MIRVFLLTLLISTQALAQIAVKDRTSTRTVTAAGSIRATDSIVLVNAGSGAYTLSLPKVSTIPNQTLKFVKISSDLNYVTLQPAVGDTISGRANWRLAVKEDSIELAASSANSWVIVSKTQRWKAGITISGTSPGYNTGSYSEINGNNLSAINFRSSTTSLPVGMPCASGNNPTALTTTGPQTCSVGNEVLGITYDLPNAGKVEACYVIHVNADNGGCVSCTVFFSAKIAESTLTNQAIIQSTEKENSSSVAIVKGATGGTVAGPAWHIRDCDEFTHSTSGQKLYRMYGIETGDSSATILTDGSNDRRFTIDIRPVD